MNSSDYSGRSRKRSSDARLMSFLRFVFGVFGESRQFPGADSSLFALMLDLKMYLASPAVAMCRTNQ